MVFVRGDSECLVNCVKQQQSSFSHSIHSFFRKSRPRSINSCCCDGGGGFCYRCRTFLCSIEIESVRLHPSTSLIFYLRKLFQFDILRVQIHLFLSAFYLLFIHSLSILHSFFFVIGLRSERLIRFIFATKKKQ